MDPLPGAAQESGAAQEELEEKQFAISGDVYSLQAFKEGFLLLYSTQDSSEQYVCFQDKNNHTLWEYEISPFRHSLHVLGDDGIFIRTNHGFALLDTNGVVLWEMSGFGNLDMNVAFSDHDGGIYLLERDLSANYQCIIYHIDRDGQIVSREPFEVIENLYALSGWPRIGGGYWLYGTRIKGEEHFLTHLDENLHVVKTFELLANQYPAIEFLPEDNRILLYGQAYQSDPWTEYGFVYELDYDMNQMKYVEFDGCVPRSLMKLKDGRFLVTCYNREDIAVDICTLFDSNWEEIAPIRLDFGFTALFPLDNGGFAVTGGRLSPGQSYYALFSSSVRPRLDLVYERYGANCKLESRKTYPAETGNSGYDHYPFVDKNGNIYLF